MAQVLSLQERAACRLVNSPAVWERFLRSPEGGKWLAEMVRRLTPPALKIRLLDSDLLDVRTAVLQSSQGHTFQPTGRVQLNGLRREFQHWSCKAAHRRKLEAIDQARSDVEQLAADPPESVDGLEAALAEIRQRIDEVRHDTVELEGLVWLSGDQLEMMTHG